MTIRASILIAAALVAVPAHADKPWEAGVAADTRKRAQAIFEEGNRLFSQQAYQPALEQYRAAIALWDHPVIRLNMVATELRLDRVLEAAVALDAALRFGEAPFDDDEREKAARYGKQIAALTGHVEVSCEERDAQVQLDGKPWFTCPATQKQLVVKGEHTVIGEKRDYLTVSRRIDVEAGDTAEVALRFIPLEEAVRRESPVARWIPWTVAGGGAAVALVGLGVWISGRSQMDQFENDYAKACPDGCRADLSDVASLRADKESAERKGTISTVMFISGGAIVTAGVIWAVVFNRPRRITPAVQATSDGAAVTAAWEF
jgi:tetratricopeptide (TPR) repeat protein